MKTRPKVILKQSDVLRNAPGTLLQRNIARHLFKKNTKTRGDHELALDEPLIPLPEPCLRLTFSATLEGGEKEEQRLARGDEC